MKKQAEEYELKDMRGAKVGRVILWIMLSFLFVKGVLASFAPDQEEDVRELITQFRSDFASYKDNSAEMLSFAQNFAAEYLTYGKTSHEEYQKRLLAYMPSSIVSGISSMQASGSSEVIYAEAYRYKEISETQAEVYVLLAVKYTITNKSKDEEGAEVITETVSTQPSVLKVPIYHEDGKYVVESLPMFVADTMYLSTYQKEVASRVAYSGDQQNKIKTSIIDFLKAYYSQPQSVINYYLAKDADSDLFTGLEGRFEYKGINAFACYEEADGFLCQVDVAIVDPNNQAVLRQLYYIKITLDTGRYYIQSISLQ